MRFSSLLSFLKRNAERNPACRSLRRNPERLRFVPRLAGLEDRTVPSTVWVTSAADDGSGGTLRAALGRAGDGDTIRFASNLRGHTIALTQGELVLDKSVTIAGLGANALAISGSGHSRTFEVENNATATITDLAVRDGFADTGGAIANDAGSTLMLAGDVLSDNTGNGMGGAIYNAGTLTVRDSVLTDNAGMRGSINIRHQTLSNTFDTLMGGSAGGMSGMAGMGGGMTGLMGMGGAIYNVGALTIDHSALFNNAGLVGSVAISDSSIANTFDLDMSGGAGGTGGTMGTGGMTGVGNGVYGLMGMGGAVYNEGTLDVSQSVLFKNAAVIGTIAINHSTLTNTLNISGMSGDGSGMGGTGMGGSRNGSGGGMTGSGSGMGGMMGMGNGAYGLMGMGGGLCNMGTVTVEGSSLSGNVAVMGGIAINDSTLSNAFNMPDMSGMSGGMNGGTGMGGGGSMTTGGMMGVGNGTAGIMGMGGAVCNMGTLTLTNSRVQDNVAVVGAIAINNSTLTETFNTGGMAGGMGGGMSGGTGGGMGGMTAMSGVGNGTGGIMAMGGGIANSGTLTNNDSIVSHNHAALAVVRVNHSTLSSNGGDVGTGMGAVLSMDDDIHDMTLLGTNVETP